MIEDVDPPELFFLRLYYKLLAPFAVAYRLLLRMCYWEVYEYDSTTTPKFE